MTLDALDAAFVHRWRAARPPAPQPQHAVVASPVPAIHQAAAVPPAAPPAEAAEAVAPPGCSVVDRLLAAALPQWNAVADRVEAARARGRRVIAVAGCDRGEGRTTLVAALARVLRSRQREVQAVEPGELPMTAGATCDKRIILVDAGVWFPPGPIRRQRLMIVSHGCEAALIVRRADRQPVVAIEAALEAIGIEPLGEVVTFARPAVEEPVA
jgi:hypothetical protein